MKCERFKYGMLTKKPQITARVYDRFGRLLPRRHRITLYDDERGVLNDGRPVQLINGKWRIVDSWWNENGKETA